MDGDTEHSEIESIIYSSMTHEIFYECIGVVTAANVSMNMVAMLTLVDRRKGGEQD